jgi:phenylpyruvate tautomerase PptA (4-oxalocrotonate tautomerase family)
MPAVLIEVRYMYSVEEETKIIDAVHAAMMTGIKTPKNDKNIRLIVHEPHRFTSAPDKSEKYTLISFDMFTGRSPNAKKNLYKAIVDNLETLGIPRNDVFIVLREHPPENWGVRGGQAASEVDLGFEINI